MHQNGSVLVLRYLFERQLANFDFFSKLRTAVYPPNKSRIGVKLWQNAFQTICKLLFFDADFFLVISKFSGSIDFLEKVRFWRSYEFFIPVGRCVVKSYYPKCPYFWGDFLVQGVKDSICVLDLDLAPKMTLTLRRYDVMINF